MVSCVTTSTAHATPVTVGPLPIDQDLEAAVRHNGGQEVEPAEAQVMIWQGHSGEGFAEWLAAAPGAEWVQLPSAGIDWIIMDRFATSVVFG